MLFVLKAGQKGGEKLWGISREDHRMVKQQFNDLKLIFRKGNKNYEK